MIYFVLAVLIALFGIYCVYRQIKEERKNPNNEGSWFFVSLLSFLTAIIVVIGVLVSFVGWQKKAKEYEFLGAFVENKIAKIEMMKQSYHEIAYEPDMNIDLVNKDLTSNITDEIRDLEEFVYDYNVRLAEWTVKYRYRFWNTCFVPPPLDEPIELSKWIQPAPRRKNKRQ